MAQSSLRIQTKPPLLEIADHPQRQRELAVAARAALGGQLNNTLTFTLTGDGVATSTQVDVAGVGPGSVVLIMPTTANAAGS